MVPPAICCDAVNADQPIDALVTRVTLSGGKPHGVCLARTLRATEGIGELVPHPVEMEMLVEAAERAGGGKIADKNLRHSAVSP